MKLKKKAKVIIGVLIFFFLFLLIFLGISIYFMAPVDSSDTTVKEIIIEEGSSSRVIASLLKEENIIKNEEVFLVYLKIRKADNSIYAAKYELSSSMELKEVVDVLLEGGNNKDELSITFKEGWKMTDIAKAISKNTNHSYKEVLNYLKKPSELDSFIKKYWFLTDDVKNKSIYYPLEGYLFPETYNFANKDVKLKDIVIAMLDQMALVLKPYEKDIKKNNYSIHELLTVASMTELEGFTLDSKKNISGIIYNRLDEGMSLGIDATSYYALQIDVGERELSLDEFLTDNPYNTRASSMAGKLPVGPVASASKDSIEAAIYPNDVDYLYYVTDKNNKFYYMNTYSEHEKKVDELRKKGLWYEW